MNTCTTCGHELFDGHRYCTRCGKPIRPTEQTATAAPNLPRPATSPDTEELNMTALYVMVAALLLALLIPPWETPPGHPPEFLGFSFYWEPPERGAVVSRMMATIELSTIGIAGLYCSWLLRKKK
ncbi:MAG: hypothetical protein ACKOBZ_00420 [Nitrospira sp.]